MNNPQVLAATLQRQFPGVAFRVLPSPSGRTLDVFWDGATPSESAVGGVFRASGLLVTDSQQGYVAVRLPTGGPDVRQPPPPRAQTPRRTTPPRPSQKALARKTRDGRLGGAVRGMQAPATPTFGAAGLWSIADLGILVRTAENWVRTLETRGTVTYYTAGMCLLALGSGFLAWSLDIRPSLIFGQHLAAELSATSVWFPMGRLETGLQSTVSVITSKITSIWRRSLISPVMPEVAIR